jgi:catechol 2,3-dioxygenase-like lactoylglutathione lyase family enzyme
VAMSRITCVSFTCADADRLAAFYVSALGFQISENKEYSGPSFSRLIGIEEANARSLRLRLGAQQIELLTFANTGAPYPTDCPSNDLRFQHIAIVVSNMQAAYEMLSRHDGWAPITTKAPQKLPQSSGGVTAFKFRDPEGHPLELLAFPSNEVRSPWQLVSSAASPCLGIDHSAIVVASTGRSVAFYDGLGFAIGEQSLNRGKEQIRLDSVPDAVVQVTSLEPEPVSTPHLELLCYLSPARQLETPSLLSNDIAATRLLIELDDFTATEKKLKEVPVSFISSGTIRFEHDRPAALIRDPDGHSLFLLGQ